jgi:hypothetical protein
MKRVAVKELDASALIKSVIPPWMGYDRPENLAGPARFCGGADPGQNFFCYSDSLRLAPIFTRALVRFSPFFALYPLSIS